jgi:pimeloyl-ACP methyl ester carboxylesterase
MEGFADDIAWMCHALGLENPVIIGHSMGGLVALILAARHAALPRAIVMLDMPTALIDGPLATGHPRLQNAEALRSADYRDVVAQLAEGMFLPTDDHDRRAWIGKRMAAVPQYVLQSSFAEGWTCDLRSAAAACKVPALYIQASTERPELDRFKDLCPQLVLGRTVGAGHFHQLEVPGQVNSMIERFLLVSAPRPEEIV